MPQGAENLDLLVTDGVGLEINGRLHGHEGEELHDVVLNHVAQNAGFFVVGAAAFQADGFGHGDLHGVDVATVPDRFEDDVGEAQDEDVLDGLFTR